MINQVVLVGRIANKLKLYEDLDKKEYTYVRLAVPRTFKNEDGLYDTDYIECKLNNHIARKTIEYCKQGDIIAIRGRVANLENERENMIIADKITFLNSNSKSE